jgi:hypothetical protein
MKRDIDLIREILRPMEDLVKAFTIHGQHQGDWNLPLRPGLFRGRGQCRRMRSGSRIVRQSTLPYRAKCAYEPGGSSARPMP